MSRAVARSLHRHRCSRSTATVSGSERGPALLARLGVLLDDVAVLVDVHASPQGQHSHVQVDRRPPQRAQLPSSRHARGHGMIDN
jgi:hypothetical protein